ncbi:MAG: Hsp20/alpha crystallin family protein [Planctomycetes bacterium]|nr:Hsp20/alpha crystallin family protein [Planctomycetota bacterium]
MTQQTHAWGSNFGKLADHMRTMLDEMHGRNYFRSHAPDMFQPRVNLYETAGSYHICVELAGMPREDIDVRVDDGRLYIRGQREKPVVPAGEADVSVTLMEIDSGRFQRKLPLPDDAQLDGMTALYKNGFLWITIPRTGESG